MKICFVCCRPFQLLNSINYIENILDKSETVSIDLFLLNKFKSELNLSQANYFNNIFYFNEINNSRLTKLSGFVFLQKWISKSMLNGDIFQIQNYDVIFGTSFNSFFVRLCNLNQNAEIIFLEDGIGTYMNDDYQLHQKSLFSKSMKIIHRGVLSLSIKKLYCYHPEIICIEKPFPIESLPLLSGATLKSVENIFHYVRDDHLYRKKVIYFTSDSTWENRFIFQECNLIDILYRFKDRTILRFHPNSINTSYKDMEVDDSKQLWELQCSQITEDSILIGIFSTAQFSPYLFYGKKYTIIFLYKIVFPPDSYLFKQCERTVEMLKKDFPDVFVPKTIDEYQAIIKQLLEK